MSRAGETVARSTMPGAAAVAIDDTGETKKVGAPVFSDRALTGKPVTPLSPPPRHLHQVQTESSVPIRP